MHYFWHENSKIMKLEDSSIWFFILFCNSIGPFFIKAQKHIFLIDSLTQFFHLKLSEHEMSDKTKSRSDENMCFTYFWTNLVPFNWILGVNLIRPSSIMLLFIFALFCNHAVPIQACMPEEVLGPLLGILLFWFLTNATANGTNSRPFPGPIGGPAGGPLRFKYWMNQKHWPPSYNFVFN